MNLLNTFIKDEWFNRPKFLHCSECEWPRQKPSIPQLSPLEMKKTNFAISNENRV